MTDPRFQSRVGVPALRVVNVGALPRRRTVRADDGAPDIRWADAAHAVEVENRAAAALTASDARWAMAVRAAASLEGGRAAVLPPEKRDRLVALGGNLGLRPFDTNLVIAIVQDAARLGEGLHGPSVEPRLRLTPAHPVVLLVMAGALAVVMVQIALAWLTE
ncbi:MAG TPA: hypothetical protein PLU35_08455 [Phycisphaerales bacterium]|nr:hypothetical protein [Phycisphaerales bacterium]